MRCTDGDTIKWLREAIDVLEQARGADAPPHFVMVITITDDEAGGDGGVKLRGVTGLRSNEYQLDAVRALVSLLADDAGFELPGAEAAELDALILSWLVAHDVLDESALAPGARDGIRQCATIAAYHASRWAVEELARLRAIEGEGDDDE